MNHRKFLESLRYALARIAYCFKTQRNIRIHSVFTVFVLAFGLAIRISRLEFIVIIMVISLVFICEIFNTAIEKAVDTSTQEYHPIAKISKDVAAGAVLVSSINAIIIGCLIFGRYIWAIILKIIGNGL